MEHPHLDESLSSYLSGEMSPEERHAAERHLSRCSACMDKLDKLQRLNDVLSQVESLEPSPHFLEGVLKKVNLERQAAPVRSRKMIAILALAAVLIFVVLVLKLYHPKQQPSPVAHRNPIHRPSESQTTKSVNPKPQPNRETTPPPPSPQINKDDSEMIANLDALENMDLILNYDDVENVDIAVIGGEEKTE